MEWYQDKLKKRRRFKRLARLPRYQEYNSNCAFYKCTLSILKQAKIFTKNRQVTKNYNIVAIL